MSSDPSGQIHAPLTFSSPVQLLQLTMESTKSFVVMSGIETRAAVGLDDLQALMAAALVNLVSKDL